MGTHTTRRLLIITHNMLHFEFDLDDFDVVFGCKKDAIREQ